jgi:hypothetical protein
MLCPVSATQSAAALLHHLGRSIDRASRSRHSKFKPAVLGEIQAAGDTGMPPIVPRAHGTPATMLPGATNGPVAGLVGIEVGVVSGVINLDSPGVEAPVRRPRHEECYQQA